jgi:hypothetical protein
MGEDCLGGVRGHQDDWHIGMSRVHLQAGVDAKPR